jgi:hypothetical protein
MGGRESCAAGDKWCRKPAILFGKLDTQVLHHLGNRVQTAERARSMARPWQQAVVQLLGAGPRQSAMKRRPDWIREMLVSSAPCMIRKDGSFASGGKAASRVRGLAASASSRFSPTAAPISFDSAEVASSVEPVTAVSPTAAMSASISENRIGGNQTTDAFSAVAGSAESAMPATADRCPPAEAPNEAIRVSS